MFKRTRCTYVFQGMEIFLKVGCLVPELKPGQYVVMDNVNFHKSETVEELIENAGCTLIYLPTYSPDLNPIEKFWANLKRKIRGVAHNFNTIQESIDFAFQVC